MKMRSESAAGEAADSGVVAVGAAGSVEGVVDLAEAVEWRVPVEVVAWPARVEGLAEGHGLQSAARLRSAVPVVLAHDQAAALVRGHSLDHDRTLDRGPAVDPVCNPVRDPTSAVAPASDRAPRRCPVGAPVLVRDRGLARVQVLAIDQALELGSPIGLALVSDRLLCRAWVKGALARDYRIREPVFRIVKPA